MFFLLFGFWLILNGQWTTEIALVGVVVCALLYAFMAAFLGYSPRKEWRAVKRIPGMAKYFVFLLGEVFKSAWATLRLIWSPKMEIQPAVTSFRTKLKTDAGKVALANSITLTPGTITVDVRDDLFLVHCLDEENAAGLQDNEMEKRLALLEEDGSHA